MPQSIRTCCAVEYVTHTHTHTSLVPVNEVCHFCLLSRSAIAALKIDCVCTMMMTFYHILHLLFGYWPWGCGQVFHKRQFLFYTSYYHQCKKITCQCSGGQLPPSPPGSYASACMHWVKVSEINTFRKPCDTNPSLYRYGSYPVRVYIDAWEDSVWWCD